MKRTRRELFREAACGLGATAFLSALTRFSRVDAATSGPATDYRALVCVFLFGGNDGNATVIPYDGYSAYSKVRGSSLGIPKASLHQISAASQGAAFGLHPGLTELASLYDKGRLAVLCNVGTLAAPVTRSQYLAGADRPDSLFSHADQQAQWQSSVVKALVPGTSLQGFPATPTAEVRLAALRQLLTEDGATLARWYGADPAALPAVFPNLGRFAKPDLGFLGS